MKRSELDALIGALKKLRETADDKAASDATGAFPRLHGNGVLVCAGTRILWTDGALYRARTDLWDTAENTPDAAPNLWERVMYRAGVRVIPSQIPAENPFAAGEYGWWGDTLYRSRIASNVWTPEAYPAGWEKLE